MLNGIGVAGRSLHYNCRLVTPSAINKGLYRRLTAVKYSDGSSTEGRAVEHWQLPLLPMHRAARRRSGSPLSRRELLSAAVDSI